MSRRRGAVPAAALVALISLLGACDTNSSRESTAVIDQRSAAANQAAAVRHRLLIARRRAAAARRRAATPTTIVTQARFAYAGDRAAIQKAFEALNAAFGASNAGNQCASFARARNRGAVSEALVVYLDSLSLTPGWVDPAVGRVPAGRTYLMAIRDVQTLVSTGQRRARTLWIHVTVGPDGTARLFLRCH